VAVLLFQSDTELINIKYLGGGPKPDGTQGIASVTLTLNEPDPPIQISGCIVPNNEGLKSLLNDYNYIQRLEGIKYFVYFYCSQQNWQTRLVNAKIRVYRFTKPSRSDKLCTLTGDEVRKAIYTVSGNHQFLPCESFNNSEFLKTYSLGIPEAVPIELSCDGSYEGVIKEQGRVKSFSFDVTSSNNSSLVLSDDNFNTLVDGPLLLGKRVAGWYKKATENNRITVYKFGTQGEEANTKQMNYVAVHMFVSATYTMKTSALQTSEIHWKLVGGFAHF